MEVNQIWPGLQGILVWEGSHLRTEGSRRQRGGGAGNKGLWQVQTALQEHERRECLPPGFEGKEGGWGKSQERVLGGEVRGGF